MSHAMQEREELIDAILHRHPNVKRTDVLAHAVTDAYCRRTRRDNPEDVSFLDVLWDLATRPDAKER